MPESPQWLLQIQDRDRFDCATDRVSLSFHTFVMMFQIHTESPVGLMTPRRGLCRAVNLFAVLLLAAAYSGCSDASSRSVGGDGASPSPDVPETFRVTFETSAGPFEVEFVRNWSPAAVDRVLELAEIDFWAGSRIYRVNERYVQFGYSGRPEIDAEWIAEGLPDEPTRSSNVRGSVSFARGGPGTRSAILFINRSDNTDLDELPWNGVTGFPPVGRVVRGMESVDELYAGYGDTPLQWEDSIAGVGNPFLDREYPELDSITSLNLLRGDPR